MIFIQHYFILGLHINQQRLFMFYIISMHILETMGPSQILYPMLYDIVLLEDIGAVSLISSKWKPWLSRALEGSGAKLANEAQLPVLLSLSASLGQPTNIKIPLSPHTTKTHTARQHQLRLLTLQFKTISDWRQAHSLPAWFSG